MPQDVIWTKAIFVAGLVFNQENTVILLTFYIVFMVLSTYVMEIVFLSKGNLEIILKRKNNCTK